ncbi:unnamed protein product [Amoebophrya sp. A25]|nr:unnamed protein product [Amoebophrya sp. A25]|eukprot:GSA25T00004470001.1
MQITPGKDTGAISATASEQQSNAAVGSRARNAPAMKAVPRGKKMATSTAASTSSLSTARGTNPNTKLQAGRSQALSAPAEPTAGGLNTNNSSTLLLSADVLEDDNVKTNRHQHCGNAGAAQAATAKKLKGKKRVSSAKKPSSAKKKTTSDSEFTSDSEVGSTSSSDSSSSGRSGGEDEPATDVDEGEVKRKMRSDAKILGIQQDQEPATGDVNAQVRTRARGDTIRDDDDAIAISQRLLAAEQNTRTAGTAGRMTQKQGTTEMKPNSATSSAPVKPNQSTTGTGAAGAQSTATQEKEDNVSAGLLGAQEKTDEEIRLPAARPPSEELAFSDAKKPAHPVFDSKKNTISGSSRATKHTKVSSAVLAAAWGGGTSSRSTQQNTGGTNTSARAGATSAASSKPRPAGVDGATSTSTNMLNPGNQVEVDDAMFDGSGNSKIEMTNGTSTTAKKARVLASGTSTKTTKAKSTKAAQKTVKKSDVKGEASSSSVLGAAPSSSAASKKAMPSISAALSTELDQLSANKGRKGKQDRNGFSNFMLQSKAYERRMRANPNRQVAANKRLRDRKRGGKMNFSADPDQLQGRARQNYYLSKREQLAKETFAQRHFMDNPGWKVPLYSRGFGRDRTVVKTPAEALEKVAFQSFRNGQAEAIDAVTRDSRRTLLILPTGMGKSLTYQICALLLRDQGMTLVVTPLVALMADQLKNLPVCIRGAAINSHQTPEQSRKVMAAVRNGEIDLLFVTPERLAMWALSSRDFPIALVCVDEAHCVSIWSHNFRPTYMRLNYFFQQLNIPRVLALTATATNRAITGIQDLLKIDTVLRQNIQGEIVQERRGVEGEDACKVVAKAVKEQTVKPPSEAELDEVPQVTLPSALFDNDHDVSKKAVATTAPESNTTEDKDDRVAHQMKDEDAVKALGSADGKVDVKSDNTDATPLVENAKDDADGQSEVKAEAPSSASASASADGDAESKVGQEQGKRSVLSQSILRRNLTCTVCECDEKKKADELLYLLNQDDRFRAGPILVYVWRRATVTALARLLSGRGVNCVGYHSSLAAEDRDRFQKEFTQNRIRVLVTTIAFGMGIDKPDIQGVIHYDMPKSLENFVQESGRCARDLNRRGHCHVFVNAGDFAQQRKYVFGSIGAHGSAVDKLLDLVFNRKRRHALQQANKGAGGGTQQTAEEQVDSIVLNEKETARVLGCETDEVHSLLANLERLSGDAFRLYSSFPATLRMRFFGVTPEELSEKDIFLRELLPLCRTNSGVRTIDTLAAIKALNSNTERGFSLASTPGEFLTNLNVCAGIHKISLERDNYGYLLEVLQNPSRADLTKWGCSLKAHVREVEQVAAQQIDACYCAFDRVSTAAQKLRDGTSSMQNPLSIVSASTALLSFLVDLYFYSTEGEDVVAKISGSADMKHKALSNALGLSIPLLIQLQSVDEKNEAELWRKHPEYSRLKRDVYTTCASALLRTAMKKAKEPVLFVTNILMGRFCTMLGPDLDARWRWMKNPAWNTLQEWPFGLVHLCASEAWQAFVNEDIDRAMRK